MKFLNRSHKLTTLRFLVVLMTSSLKAQLDPSILLRSNPPQFPNMTDTVIRLQQLKLQQQQAEEQARLAENARREQEQNRLRQGQSPDAHLTMKQLMLPDVFAAAGLQKLSPEELVILDAWITFYSIGLKNLFQTQPSPTSGDVIEAKIADSFDGWSGDTIFKLDNGQIWQQSSYAYTYHYAYRPDVLIFRGGGPYRMKVNDVPGTIEVKRLK